MPTDISRKLFNRKKHYSGVINQQGRVTLDADLNEQLDIQLYRTHTETKDVIGYCGVPKKNGGFLIQIIDGTGLTIAPGRIYVGGLLCQLEKTGQPITYFTQPYYPDPDTTYLKDGVTSSPPESPASPPSSPASPPDSPPGSNLNIADGVYIVYIDAWNREVNFLDDPLIQEVALGEADTTARLQTVWQVKLLKVDAANNPAATCKTPFAEWMNLVKDDTGKLNAQTKKDAVPDDPCSLKPGTGFRGLENQLYRVEIQKGTSLADATFKWSRDNATLETTIEKIDGNTLTVSSIGKDDIMSFANGQWVEIVDEISVLHGSPNPLVYINGVKPETREITLNTSAAGYVGKDGLKLRRWDQTDSSANENGLLAGSGWITLEDGVQVTFSPGTYRPGNYWLIPARTATAEIEWPLDTLGIASVEQPPVGTKHYYCKLALLKANDGLVTLEDCRELFPSLTDICAEDVCFKNDNCDLGRANTVQDALDLLCAANDLRDHNKHLHGYGVVCGLKVVCGPSRDFVLIESGYALDCEGNIIRLKKRKGIAYNIVAEAANAGLLDENGNGQVSMSIGYKGKDDPSVSIEQYIKKTFWQEILEGSLLQDFFNDDIKPLVDFVKKQLPFPLTDTPPIPIGQQRLTALINLLWQQVNSASGPYIFLSGGKERSNICNQKPEEKQNEDQLLFCLYQELKALLASETFCAMFDNDHPFPTYNIDPGLDTIFGPVLKFHYRLRLNPKGKFAYTCGKDNKIYVYDLTKRLLLQTLVFPSSVNIKLQDIAVSTKGTEMYATGLLDDKDSVIAVVSIDVASGKHTWVNGSSVKCAFKYVSLAFNDKFGLHAVSKTKGLYRITGIGTAAFAETQIRAFNATGLIVIPDGQNIAYVANNTLIGTETDTFSQIDAVDLSTNALIRSYNAGGSNWQDDITIFRDRLFVTGSSGSQRVLRGFVITSGAPAFPDINLEQSSSMRLSAIEAGDSEYILVAMSDKYKVARVNLKKLNVDAKFRIPVQLFPMGIVVTEKRDAIYVLNSLVNTLTAIQVEQTFRSPQPNFTEEPPFDIAKYHDGVILAYKDLTHHFLQHLKDAFCGKFIIDCPDCSEKDKVYLGTVMIKGRKVYRICNFTKRRYVKTFRTWGYWLSTVPILPALKTSFAKFCCSVIDKTAPW
jgi:DNA-binding beta-propeller fold protein YncE